MLLGIVHEPRTPTRFEQHLLRLHFVERYDLNFSNTLVACLPLNQPPSEVERKPLSMRLEATAKTPTRREDLSQSLF